MDQVHDEYYPLAKEFGWTVQQVDDTPVVILDRLRVHMRVCAELDAAARRAANRG